MPIVDVEIVTDDNDVSGDLASRLANSIGDALGAEPGRTWVRLRTLPHHRYAESGPNSFDGVSPVFVTITARRHPNPNDFAVVAPRVCAAAASTCGVPVENTHVIFEADASGRVAFGGTLVAE